MKKIVLLLIILALLPMTPVFAVKVTSLYQAQLPVAAQTEDLKAQAIKDGLLQVLIKLSGDPQIENNPIIKPNLQRADYYVQEISYSATTTSSSEYTIQIRYDAEDVKRLLKKAGMAFWGETRPLILVWLAVSNKESATEIIGNENPGDIYTAINEQSKKYGLPLIFPVMDVNDVSQVSTDDVVNMTLPVLREAGRRYTPDAMLIGRMTQTEQGFSGDWRLVADGTKWNWTIADKTPDEVIGTLMNEVSQALAKHYSVKATDVPEVWIKLEVMNITQRNDLTQLMQSLKRLELIQQIKLLEVSGDVVELAVLVRGSIAAFQKNVVIDQRIVPKYEDLAASRLGYVWSH